MRSFIFGEQDAWAGHKPSHITVLGLILSGSGSYILTMDGNFLVIVVPVISYLILSAVLRPGLNKKAVRDPKYLSDESYLDGYHRIAKSKKNKNALWGSVAGFWAGGLIAMQQKDWKFE
jgi:hypothetical protein